MLVVPLTCSGFAACPVASPVMITPPLRNNSAARAVSANDTSAVIAWELNKISLSLYSYVQAVHVRAHQARRLNSTKPVFFLDVCEYQYIFGL